MNKKNKVGIAANAKYAAAMAGMKVLPIPALISTINAMIGVLRDRGFEVRDWDDKTRSLYQITMVGGKTYALLPHSEAPPVVEKENANGGNE